MTELGQLEKHHQEFANQKLRVVVVSIEDLDLAKKTQADFPHLIVASDKDRNLSNAVQVIHPHSGPEGADTSAPTTILIDRAGVPQWVFRPGHVLTRLSPSELIDEADKNLGRVKNS
jgi:peroxiredoxin